MNPAANGLHHDELLPGLLVLYLGASLVHFVHNAEHVHDYPNLPEWISRAGVYGSWVAVTLVGILGYALYRAQRYASGLVLIGLYAALGFGGLLHYARAPFDAHTAAMNFTILFEFVAALALLAAVLRTAKVRFSKH
jgi:hypothetical protein